MPVAPSAPTTELGSAANVGVQGWGAFIDDQERALELTWPTSVQTYRIMFNDAQLDALYKACTLPIRRYRWLIDPNGARPEVVSAVARDLNLPVKGEEPQPRPRTRTRFSHGDHLRLALKALGYGHMYFEQVGSVGDDNMWHLRKLAARMPHTIEEINQAQDGGLVSIKQSVGMTSPQIPVSRLVAYIWDQEPGNWIGRSMFRSCYRSWLIKDRLMRIDAINHERAGGVPWIEGPEGATPAQLVKLAAMASQFKVGEGSGGAVPHGTKLNLAGGKASDVVQSIRLQNEEMARAWLAMFIELGQTQTGSRALGEEFVDFFALAQDAVASWYCDVTNEHVIEDFVDWNFGEGEEYAPTIVYERNPDPSLAIADLVQLIDKGGIQVDAELEGFLRDKYNMPAKQQDDAPAGKSYAYDLDYQVMTIDERRAQIGLDPLPDGLGQGFPVSQQAGAPEQTSPSPSVEATRRRRRTVAAADQTSPIPLPDRPLRRQPYEQEVQAATDFKRLDEEWQSSLDQLIEDWGDVKTEQVDDLYDKIVKANGDLSKLAGLETPAIGSDLLQGHMMNIAQSGLDQAVDEAKAQGVKGRKPKLDNLVESLRTRASAIDTMLARSLAEAAARKAVSLTGGSLTAKEVAQATKDHLLGLTDSYLRDQFGGALTQAQNSGRKLAMRENDPQRVYASEILDSNTCEACIDKDGAEYDSIDEAESDYPTGGYSECFGGPRCRGTLVAVYDEEPASR